MIRILGAIVGAMALSLASAASAAITVPTIAGVGDRNGIAKIRGDLGYFPGGPQAVGYMDFTWQRGELDDLHVYLQASVMQTFVDPFSPKGVRHEYQVFEPPICTFKGGCIEQIGEREARVRLEFPGSWDQPCVGPAGLQCAQQLVWARAYTEMFIQVGTGRSVDGTVSLSSPVPEPTTWAMMIAGFGLAGATLRHRRQGALPA